MKTKTIGSLTKKNQKLPLTKLAAGMKVLVTVTGVEFTLAKVTDKNVSWYMCKEYRANTNTMRMAWVSRQQFEHGLANGSYKLIQP